MEGRVADYLSGRLSRAPTAHPKTRKQANLRGSRRIHPIAHDARASTSRSDVAVRTGQGRAKNSIAGGARVDGGEGGEGAVTDVRGERGGEGEGARVLGSDRKRRKGAEAFRGDVVCVLEKRANRAERESGCYTWRVIDGGLN